MRFVEKVHNLIAGNSYDIANSHAWNIDGYKLKTVTTLENRYSGVTNELLSSKVKSVKTTCMVHCNFGWGGSFNGYFASGVFDLGNKEAEFDDISQKKGKTNYKWYLHTITYGERR
ncbi:MAG: C10 family peptidase [Bacteroidales bacterium]|nr:C10 family peptidase [Bacteroidales bacterium]